MQRGNIVKIDRAISSTAGSSGRAAMSIATQCASAAHLASPVPISPDPAPSSDRPPLLALAVCEMRLALLLAPAGEIVLLIRFALVRRAIAIVRSEIVPAVAAVLVHGPCLHSRAWT
jgi:hypothetical protein